MARKENTARSENVEPLQRAREAVTQTVEKTRSAVNQRLDSARDRFQEVAEEVEDRVKTASGRAREVGKDLRDQAEHARDVTKEKVDETVVQLREGYTKARKNADRMANDFNDYVRDNPAKSVLMAVGAGFLLGFLFRRRRDEQ